MPIDDLISPLRYDVRVRERFLAMINDARAGADSDPEELFERAIADPYFTWFRSIVVPSFLPRLVGHEGRIRAAFRTRVQRAVDLCESFAGRGYDAADPIVLRSGQSILPTSTGKLLARSIYAGDGCHRLALLRLSGTRELAPGSYRIEVRRRFAPLDHTAKLVSVLGIGDREYFSFLSLSYAPGTACLTRSDLLRETASKRPELLDELESVIAADLPLLSGAGTAG